MRSLRSSSALCVTLIFLLICVQARTQVNHDDSCDIPLVVTRFVQSSGNVELVKDLTAKILTVKLGGFPGSVESVSLDGGGKRIILILDASKKVLHDEWKLETEMAGSLIGNARAEDRFALVVVGDGAPAGPFLLLSEIQNRLKHLASSRPNPAYDGERVYDALLIAAQHLDPPQFGDVIFMFGHPDDSGSKASSDEVQELMLKNRLRFYGMSFTNPLLGKVPRKFDLNKPLPANVGLAKADQISHATGYFFSFHSVQALKISGQMDLLKGYLGDLYAGIAEPYRVKVDRNTSSKTPFDLAITDADVLNIREGDVHYPHFVYQCSTD